MVEKQRRNKTLDDVIVETLKLMVAESNRQGRRYVYNASALAKRAGTTRPSLNKRKALISSVLSELNQSKPKIYGATLQEQLRNKIISLESQLEQLKKENNSLRKQHIMIFDKLYSTSADVRPLKELIKQARRNGAPKL